MQVVYVYSCSVEKKLIIIHISTKKWQYIYIYIYILRRLNLKKMTVTMHVWMVKWSTLQQKIFFLTTKFLDQTYKHLAVSALCVSNNVNTNS